MLCKILIINMLDYKFKRFIFNVALKGRFYLPGCALSTNDKCLSLHRMKNTATAKC